MAQRIRTIAKRGMSWGSGLLRPPFCWRGRFRRSTIWAWVPWGVSRRERLRHKPTQPAHIERQGGEKICKKNKKKKPGSPRERRCEKRGKLPRPPAHATVAIEGREVEVGESSAYQLLNLREFNKSGRGTKLGTWFKHEIHPTISVKVPLIKRKIGGGGENSWSRSLIRNEKGEHARAPSGGRRGSVATGAKGFGLLAYKKLRKPCKASQGRDRGEGEPRKEKRGRPGPTRSLGEGATKGNEQWGGKHHFAREGVETAVDSIRRTETDLELQYLGGGRPYLATVPQNTKPGGCKGLKSNAVPF